MTYEQMQKIVDVAPEWAKYWNTRMGCYTKGNIKYYSNVDLDGLRSQLAKHDTLDLEPSDIPHGTFFLEK